MGFLKTLFTGRRDELSEEEKKQFEAAHGNLKEYQPTEEESSDKLNSTDESQDSQDFENSLQISFDDVVQFIKTSASENELIKIKNTIARVEDEKIDSDISQLREEDEYTFLDEDDSSQSDNNRKESGEEVSNNEDFLEINEYKKSEDESEIDENYKTSYENHNIESSNEVVDTIEDGDVSVSVNNKNEDDEYSKDSYDSQVDPPLFSVIHDELMELFEDGTIILLKEEFTFPSIGTRETLAFGIYNPSISNIKDQTHWFVQKLKQFSRLKECKMLLSEEYEKDLILEISEKHAILLCFKTSNLIQDEFVFNRKWD